MKVRRNMWKSSSSNRTLPAKARAGRGFTLTELMVTLVVLAIIVAVAFPSYQEHLRKGRRAAAQSFLVDVASRQQQFMMDARTYAVGTTGLTRLNMNVPADVSRYYTVTIEPAANATPPVFTILATPIAGSPQAPDGVLSIADTGIKMRNGVAGW